MARVGKKYKKASEAAAAKPAYALPEAVATVTKTAFAKFDETVEVAIRLGVDPKHADQMVRGTVILPHGLGGKSKRVLVIASGEKLNDSVLKAKPAAAKGRYVKSIALSSTMGPGVRVDLATVEGHS